MKDVNLDAENCVVIGSGILSAYGVRESNDIDVVTDTETYGRLAGDPRFAKTENHGREILSDALFEIGKGWDVLGMFHAFEDLVKHSVVVGDVRYVTLEFLLAVKKSWLHDENVRQKDIDDVKLIEQNLAQQ